MTESLWPYVGSTAIGIIITLIIFWAGIVRVLVTKEEVCEMIRTRSPYLEDRQLILERLQANKDNQVAFAQALQRNSEVMSELKVQIATLGKTLETIEQRIERAM